MDSIINFSMTGTQNCTFILDTGSGWWTEFRQLIIYCSNWGMMKLTVPWTLKWSLRKCDTERKLPNYKKKRNYWHSTIVYSRYRHQEQESNRNFKPYHISYYDHVYSRDTKQDFGAVLTHFEALLLGLKRNFPLLRKLYIQSGNAIC